MAGKKGTKNNDPLSYAVNFISYRPRSVKEVKDALRKKGFHEEAQVETLSKLSEWGLLNDALFAESWIHYRTEALAKGRFGVRRELIEKGISPDIIEQALAEYYPAELEEEILEQILEKERRRLSVKSDIEKEKALQKLAGKLQYKGFSQGAIYRGLQQLESLTIDTAWE